MTDNEFMRLNSMFKYETEADAWTGRGRKIKETPIYLFLMFLFTLIVVCRVFAVSKVFKRRPDTFQKISFSAYHMHVVFS